ncbi:hypothetical protein OSB04_021066 [Centaurea solstitialis]|uniref:Glutamate receptor n=1 Tax=Centaurea solstitialis TaxID=347529 RepID=A0AA38T178_9ASTR|nr:hypothetical protein OSB04_021066 [Centaurea solstitialis]
MMRCKMKNIPYHCCVYATILLLLLLGAASPSPLESKKKITTSVDVGLVVDVSKKSGLLLESLIKMANSDFYDTYPFYTTRLALRIDYPTSSIDVASAVVELLKDEVKAIMGPKSLVGAKFIMELGEKSHVPIISFDDSSYSCLHIQSPYLIANVVPFNASLAPIIALFKQFQWREVALVCEAGMYDTDLFPSLLDSFQNAGVHISYISIISHTSSNHQICNELHKLDELQTKIFLVYMRPELGSRLFGQAKTLEMMREGYAWVITDALANSLHSIDRNLMKSLDGVVGIRPHVPLSRDLENFRKRWQEHSHMMKGSSITTHELIVYGSWAYDTIWALATGIERIGNREELSFVKENNNKNGREISHLGISSVGHLLMKEITNPRSRRLVEELFKSRKERDLLKSYEIINLDGGERIVGYWTPDEGISRELDSNDASKNPTSVEGLKKIIWPGDTTTQPYGWLPQKGKKLRVGVPKKTGFTEFVKVEKNNDTNESNVTGFCIDLFEAALELLPFPVVPEYIPFMNSTGQSNGTYDQLLHKLQTKVELDAVIGDTTIVSYRTPLMDFTLPYTEPGIVMLVPIKDSKLNGIWVFIKPLKWDLWCTIIGACLFVGLAIRILERNGNPQWRTGLFFCFPMLILAFPERKIVANKWSRFVLVIWLFMAYIIMQGYTASLSAILTIEQLQPSRTDYSCVGYYGGSYSLEILTKQLKYNESQLHPYQTMEQFHDALKNGCQNGGVDAIFDDIPNIRLFLHRYGPKYVTVGRKYHTDGFGFAFQLGSPLVSYMSKAIVNVTESDRMKVLEDAYFGPNYSSDRDFYPQIAPEAPGLSVYNFAGLFIVIAVATIVALLCSEARYGQKCARKQGSSFSSSQIASVDDDYDDIVSINGASTNIVLTTHNSRNDAIEHGLGHVDVVADSIHDEVELTIRHN